MYWIGRDYHPPLGFSFLEYFKSISTLTSLKIPKDCMVQEVLRSLPPKNWPFFDFRILYTQVLHKLSSLYSYTRVLYPVCTCKNIILYKNTKNPPGKMEYACLKRMQSVCICLVVQLLWTHIVQALLCISFLVSAWMLEGLCAVSFTNQSVTFVARQCSHKHRSRFIGFSLKHKLCRCGRTHELFTPHLCVWTVFLY